MMLLKGNVRIFFGAMLAFQVEFSGFHDFLFALEAVPVGLSVLIEMRECLTFTTISLFGHVHLR